MNKISKALGILAAAIALPAAALDLDLSGDGSGSDVYLDQAKWDSDNIVLVNALQEFNLTHTGVYLTQGAFDLDGNGVGDTVHLSYQMAIPVIITQTEFADFAGCGGVCDGGGSLTLSLDTSADRSHLNRYKIFLHDDENGIRTAGGIDQAAGTGYGDLSYNAVADTLTDGGLGLVSAGVHAIATGAASATSTTWNITQLSEIVSGPQCLEDDYADVGEVAPAACLTIQTMSWTGGGTLDVNITDQDDGYIISDLVGDDFGLSVDLSVDDIVSQDHGFEAPFEIQVADVAASVLGHTPDFNDGYVADSLMDFNCGDEDVFGQETSICDVQGQISAITKFNDARIPEPGTIALAGLGLLLAGAGGRLRKS